MWQQMLLHEGKKAEQNIKGISIVALIAGLLVMVTSFVFSMQVARPLWNNPVEPLSFLAAALIATLSLLIMLFAILRNSERLSISEKSLRKFGNLTVVFLLFELFVVVGEVLIPLYAGHGEENTIILWLVDGRGAPFFWVEIAAISFSILLLLRNNGSTAFLVTGAALSFFSVIMIKYNLLQAQLLNPLMTYAGPVGYNSSNLEAYIPSFIEIGLSVGIVSFGYLLVLLGLDKLNLGVDAGDNC